VTPLSSRDRRRDLGDRVTLAYPARDPENHQVPRYSSLPCPAPEYSGLTCPALKYSRLPCPALEYSGLTCPAVKYSRLPCPGHSPNLPGARVQRPNLPGAQGTVAYPAQDPEYSGLPCPAPEYSGLPCPAVKYSRLPCPGSRKPPSPQVQQPTLPGLVSTAAYPARDPRDGNEQVPEYSGLPCPAASKAHVGLQSPFRPGRPTCPVAPPGTRPRAHPSVGGDCHLEQIWRIRLTLSCS
jgi:hypothetical protein